MELDGDQTTNMPPRDLFDYSNVVTFAAGEGNSLQYFAFDGPRLCSESAYFDERLHGGYPETRTRHFDFADIRPAVLACMLCWYRGWICVYCDEDDGHVTEACSLAERCRIPRFKEYLVEKME
ncbi:uncharacterized protein A1O5_10535, partial [Cladophialophora psammophila CBS 110553]